MRRYLAIDLGAESGRGVVGTLEGGRIHLEEVHRFPNGPVRLFDHLYWDALGVYREIKAAIGKAAAGGRLDAMGIDSWAVDFGLIGPRGTLVSAPRCYRDPRTDGILERAFEIVPKEEIFRETGIQFLQFNTVYQLLALKEQEPRLLEAARKMVMIGELFTYFLTGRVVGEFTNASTTQLLTPSGEWSEKLLSCFGLPVEIMPEVVQPGTEVGVVVDSVRSEVGLGQELPVIVPAVHDTGSAVAGVPASGRDWAFISSGTWSLVGMEVERPIITEESLAFNLTNEGGVERTYRLLKNVMGLWIVQELRREWERKGEALGYDELTRLASEAEPFKVLIDPDDPSFFKPGDMAERVRAYAVRTGQRPPESLGELVRCVLESLALKYRYVIDRLERAAGQRVEVVHIVGGGSQNRLLNQMTADACGRPVLAGPVEATALGNVVMQAVGQGALSGVAEGRKAIRASLPLDEYAPERTDAWSEAYERFLRLIERS